MARRAVAWPPACSSMAAWTRSNVVARGTAILAVFGLALPTVSASRARNARRLPFTGWEPVPPSPSGNSMRTAGSYSSQIHLSLTQVKLDLL